MGSRYTVVRLYRRSGHSVGLTDLAQGWRSAPAAQVPCSSVTCYQVGDRYKQEDRDHCLPALPAKELAAQSRLFISLFSPCLCLHSQLLRKEPPSTEDNHPCETEQGSRVKTLLSKVPSKAGIKICVSHLLGSAPWDRDT